MNATTHNPIQLSLVLKVPYDHPVAQRLTRYASAWPKLTKGQGTACAQFRSGHYTFRSRNPRHIDRIAGMAKRWCTRAHIAGRLTFH